MVLGSGVAAHYFHFVSHTPKASGNKHAIAYLALEIQLHAALNLPFHYTKRSSPDVRFVLAKQVTVREHD